MAALRSWIEAAFLYVNYINILLPLLRNIYNVQLLIILLLVFSG